MTKNVEVTCPRCKRPRKVGQATHAAHASASEPTTTTGRRTAERRLTCRTCRLLESIEDHKRAIKKLYRQIEERRMRGL